MSPLVLVGAAAAVGAYLLSKPSATPSMSPQGAAYIANLEMLRAQLMASFGTPTEGTVRAQTQAAVSAALALAQQDVAMGRLSASELPAIMMTGQSIL